MVAMGCKNDPVAAFDFSWHVFGTSIKGAAVQFECLWTPLQDPC